MAASRTYRDLPAPTTDEHGRPYIPDGWRAVSEILAEWTGQPRKVCAAAIERAARRGLLDPADASCRATDFGLALVQSETFVRWEVQEAWWTAQFARYGITIGRREK